MNMSITLTSNSYHSQYIGFIGLVIQIHNFRKILITDTSDSNQWKQKKTSSKANIQPSTEYCSVCKRIILIWCFVYMLSYAESKTKTSYMLLSMNMMSTSNSRVEVAGY